MNKIYIAFTSSYHGLNRSINVNKARKKKLYESQINDGIDNVLWSNRINPMTEIQNVCNYILLYTLCTL